MSVLKFQHLAAFEQGSFLPYLLFVKPPDVFKYLAEASPSHAVHIPPAHQASFWFVLEVAMLTTAYAGLFGITKECGKDLMKHAKKNKAAHIVLEFFAFTIRYNVMFYLVTDSQSNLELSMVPTVQLVHTSDHAVKFVFGKDDAEKAIAPIPPSLWRGLEQALRLIPLWQRRLSWAITTLEIDEEMSQLFRIPEPRPRYVWQGAQGKSGKSGKSGAPQRQQQQAQQQQEDEEETWAARQQENQEEEEEEASAAAAATVGWTKLPESKEKGPSDVLSALKHWKRQLSVSLVAEMDRIMEVAYRASFHIINHSAMVNATRFQAWKNQFLFSSFQESKLMSSEGKATTIGVVALKYNFNKCLSFVHLEELTGETEERQHLREFMMQPSLYLGTPESSSESSVSSPTSSTSSSSSSSSSAETPERPVRPELAFWRTSRFGPSPKSGPTSTTSAATRSSRQRRERQIVPTIVAEESTLLQELLKNGLRWLTQPSASHWVWVCTHDDAEGAWREALTAHLLLSFLNDWQQLRCAQVGLHWTMTRLLFPMVRDVEMLAALYRLSELAPTSQPTLFAAAVG